MHRSQEFDDKSRKSAKPSAINARPLTTRPKLVLPAILISDASCELKAKHLSATCETTATLGGAMRVSKTFPGFDSCAKYSGPGEEQNKTKKKEEAIHELMLPASAASISKLRNSTATLSSAVLFPLRRVDVKQLQSLPATPSSTLTTPTRKSNRSSIKSVRINPDTSRESRHVRTQVNTVNGNDEDLNNDEDDFRSNKSNSNKSSKSSTRFNMSASRNSHNSNERRRAHGRHTGSRRMTSDGGQIVGDDDPDEELIVRLFFD